MSKFLSRRTLLLSAAFMPILACSAKGQNVNIPRSSGDGHFTNSPFRHITNEQWRARLPADAYHVLREDGTERPGTSALLNEHRNGQFVCAACALPLFRSEWKFDSGTGWPSFFRAIETNIGTKDDYEMIEPRVEYHCAQCLGHQGHCFPDGPRPTGLRYCNDGVALRFVPA